MAQCDGQICFLPGPRLEPTRSPHKDTANGRRKGLSQAFPSWRNLEAAFTFSSDLPSVALATGKNFYNKMLSDANVFYVLISSGQPP